MERLFRSNLLNEGMLSKMGVKYIRLEQWFSTCGRIRTSSLGTQVLKMLYVSSFCAIGRSFYMSDKVVESIAETILGVPSPYWIAIKCAAHFYCTLKQWSATTGPRPGDGPSGVRCRAVYHFPG